MNWWLAVGLVLPLVISQRAMESVGPPRFMLLSLFLLAFLLYFYFFRSKDLAITARGRLTQGLVGLAAFFLLLMVGTSLTAVNKQEALYSTVRYLLTLVTIVLFTLTVSREEQALPRLCKALAIVLIIQSLVGIFQFYGVAFTKLPPAQSARPYGLMANRNLFASGLALLFPFCGYLAYVGNAKRKVISGIALWLGTYGIIIAQTRSAWVALGCALLIANIFVVLLRTRLGPSLVKGWVQGMAVLCVGTSLALALALAIPNDQGLVASLKMRGASLVQPGEGRSPELSVRGIFWRQSLEMMRDHPLRGVGPGNWKVAVPEYGSDGLPDAFLNGTMMRDRAHNVYLQTGAETGIVGLLLYLGIWVTAALIAIKVILKTDRNERRMLGLASLAGLCIYFVDSVFSFPNEFLLHSLLLAFILGIAVSVYEKIPHQNKAPVSFPLKKAYLLLPVGFLLFNVYLGWAKESFEHSMRNILSYEKLKRPEMILAEAKRGRNPLVTISPRGYPMEFFAAEAYTGLGQMDSALKSIQRAHQLNPGSIYIWNQMGIIYSKMNRWDEAIHSFKEALRRAPRFYPALKNLAVAYHNTRMFKESSQAFLSFNYQGDKDAIVLLASSYRNLEDYQQAAATLREGLHQFPDAWEVLENLAYLEYAHLKDMTNACEHFQRLLAVRPNHPKHEEYTRVVNYLRPRVGKTLVESTSGAAK